MGGSALGAAGAADAAAAWELTAAISRQTRKTALRANIQPSKVVEGEVIPAAARGARRSARSSSAALAMVRAAAVRNAAPGKYTGALGPENQANTCVMSGGPMIALAL